LQKLYKNWEEDPNIGFVMMKVICATHCCFYFLVFEGRKSS